MSNPLNETADTKQKKIEFKDSLKLLKLKLLRPEERERLEREECERKEKEERKRKEK